VERTPFHPGLSRDYCGLNEVSHSKAQFKKRYSRYQSSKEFGPTKRTLQRSGRHHLRRLPVSASRPVDVTSRMDRWGGMEPVQTQVLDHSKGRRSAMARNMASHWSIGDFGGGGVVVVVGRNSTPCISEHRTFLRQGRGINLINLNDCHTVRRKQFLQTRPHFLIYLLLASFGLLICRWILLIKRMLCFQPSMTSQLHYFRQFRGRCAVPSRRLS
jgi:hypothetical protein